jgi:GTPase-associated adaptor domain/Calcineurin-like phosphoesterase
MLLLHISDIHFREPDCLNPAMDPDLPYRTLILRDVRERVRVLGPVGAILIGGDVAFKGHPREFETALTWIRDLSDASGCPFAKVFVVPGNHDIDRSIVDRVPSVRNARNAIANAQAHHRERELRTQFSDPETGRSLLQPLAAYNDFAKLFSCQVYPPDHLYWKQDLPIGGGITLRLHGLTSAILSGNNDTRDGPLYVSPLQTVLEPADDVANLVMMHHPPDWLIDQDDVNNAICIRSVMHFFGHKHSQRITQERNYVRYEAGAVNPDRYEAAWRPGYNLIEISVSGAAVGRMLDVRSHLLQYQSVPIERFVPIRTRDNSDVFVDSFAMPATSPTAPVEDAPDPAIAVYTAEVPVDVEAAMGDEDTRNLVSRFWKLTMSQRREIALGLGLIDDSELQLPEPERYGRALLRAGERGLLNELTREVAARERL